MHAAAHFCNLWCGMHLPMQICAGAACLLQHTNATYLGLGWDWGLDLGLG
jgi:hypothetical protein